MPAHTFNSVLARQLQDLLELQYEKLFAFRRELELCDGIDQRVAVRQRIRSDLLPRLIATEQELAKLLAIDPTIDGLIEEDALSFVTELDSAATASLAALSPQAPAEMVRLLNEIHAKLHTPGKSAAAKLKIAIPIIPALVKYELELDTENFLLGTWRALKSRLNTKRK